MKRLASIVCLLWLSSVSPAGAADIRILIEDLVNQKGQVRIAIFTQAEADQFPNGNAVRRINTITATIAKQGVVVKDLPSGIYAIAIFHDADGDDIFDSNVLGIPQESYGFSRNATPGFFSPPDFTDAAFQLDATARKQMTIRMQTW